MKWRQKEIMAYKNEKKKTTFKEKNYCFFPKEKWKENTNPRYWYTNDKITE